MRTIAVEGRVDSLTLPRIIAWLWQSIMPGVTCLPLRSTTLILERSKFLIDFANALIFPFSINSSPFFNFPFMEQVQMVALVKRMDEGILIGFRSSLGNLAIN